MPKPKVTIVDDDRDTRELLSFALESEGFEVNAAEKRIEELLSSDGQDEVVALQAGVKPPVVSPAPATPAPARSSPATSRAATPPPEDDVPF